MEVPTNPLLALEPEDDWKEIVLPYKLGSGFSYRSEKPLVNGTFTRLFQAKDWVVGWVYFGKGAAGPPGYAHGGTQVCILDDVMGATVWNDGKPSVAGEFKIDFAEMSVALEKVLVVEATIESQTDSTSKVWASIRSEEGRVATEAEATFVHLDKNQVMGLFEGGGYPLDEFKIYCEEHAL